MAGDRHDAAIVGSTVELAHRLGLRVIDGGVATPAAWELFADCAGEEARGYFVARPLLSAQLLAWLRAVGR